MFTINPMPQQGDPTPIADLVQVQSATVGNFDGALPMQRHEVTMRARLDADEKISVISETRKRLDAIMAAAAK